jgi:hypothetical protein
MKRQKMNTITKSNSEGNGVEAQDKAASPIFSIVMSWSRGQEKSETKT